VGGSGKTPIAAWIARYYSRFGLTPGIVLRGYGGDEATVHRKLVRDAVVIENPDRLEGAASAVADGAVVVVLDDAYQRLDIERDINIAVVSAESLEASRWTLPAGPWREGWRALRRADLVIVTRKRASLDAAEATLERVKLEVGDACPVAVARLGISGFHGLMTGATVNASELNGANVVVAAGIADPDTFCKQCEALGANVRLLPWRDHQRLSVRDLGELQAVGRDYQFTVVTEKDAGKMVGRWPVGTREPIVAELDLAWERGGAAVQDALLSAVEGIHQRAVAV